MYRKYHCSFLLSFASRLLSHVHLQSACSHSTHLLEWPLPGLWAFSFNSSSFIECNSTNPGALQSEQYMTPTAKSPPKLLYRKKIKVQRTREYLAPPIKAPISSSQAHLNIKCTERAVLRVLQWWFTIPRLKRTLDYENSVLWSDKSKSEILVLSINMIQY